MTSPLKAKPLEFTGGKKRERGGRALSKRGKISFLCTPGSQIRGRNKDLGKIKPQRGGEERVPRLGGEKKELKKKRMLHSRKKEVVKTDRNLSPRHV